MTATITSIDKAKATARLKGDTIGSNIDEIWKIREQKRAKEAEIKKLDTDIAELEAKLLERMDSEDTTKSAGRSATASITTSVVANVENWDLLWPWIAKNKYFHLVQKRVNDPGIRELWEKHKTVPGVQPFTKRKINIRTATEKAAA
jgi:hypothetical protein